MKTLTKNTPPLPGAVEQKEQYQFAFNLCVRKTRKNIKDLADVPKTWSNDIAGRYENFNESFYDIGNWTSSFFTGMALIAWQELEDEYFLKQVLRLAPHYREKVFAGHINTHHDLGFLYSLYSVALHRLTGDEEHRAVGLRAAEVLAQRFNPVGKFIRAWGHMNTAEHDNMAIIDCLMNLPLLYWASKESGDRKFYDIAVQHADMVLKHFIRPDDSIFHAYRFDLKTGAPLCGDNYCGFSKDSYWARGTAWAIYGFALSYGYTREYRYLDAAIRIARKFISSLDDEIVPMWDFRLTPEAAQIRDSSAAAVAVCGFQELLRHGVTEPSFIRVKDALLNKITNNKYLDFGEHCRGVLKDGQVNVTGPGTAKNVFTSWGDYFLMEALTTELSGVKTFW